MNNLTTKELRKPIEEFSSGFGGPISENQSPDGFNLVKLVRKEVPLYPWNPGKQQVNQSFLGGSVWTQFTSRQANGNTWW